MGPLSTFDAISYQLDSKTADLYAWLTIDCSVDRDRDGRGPLRDRDRDRYDRRGRDGE